MSVSKRKEQSAVRKQRGSTEHNWFDKEMQKLEYSDTNRSLYPYFRIVMYKITDISVKNHVNKYPHKSK